MTRVRDPDGGRPAASTWLAGASAAVLAVLALMLGAAPRASAASPSFNLAPPSQTIAQNAPAVSVDVVLNDAAGIAGWSFQLSYNPDALSFVSAEADTSLLLKAGAPEVYCPNPESDQAAGLVQVRCSALGGDKDASGSAKVATIRFKPKAPGRSDLLFQRTGLVDRRSATIAVSAGAGVIRVLGPGEVAGGVAPTPGIASPVPADTPAAGPTAAPAGTATPPIAVAASKGTGPEATQHSTPWLRYLGVASAAAGGVAIAAGIRAWRRRPPLSPQASSMISERKMDQPEDRSEDFFAQIAQRTQQMKATLANLKRSVPSPGESPAASAEGAVSFLSLLEQRADQLKTTLANLKADKMRAEALIAQLEPLMPQYDALIAAERSLVDAQADIDHAQQEQAETAPGG
jgi:hypothetical protein